MKAHLAAWLVSLYLLPGLAIGYFASVMESEGMALLCLRLFPFALLLNAALGLALVVRLALGLARGRFATAFLARAALACKLLALPFFVVNFGLWLALSAAFLVVPGLQVFLLADLLGAAYAWLVLLVGSVFSLAALWRARRAGGLAGARFALAVVSQLLFVADVIAWLVLFFRLRRAWDAPASP